MKREALIAAAGARLSRLLLSTVRLRLDDRSGFMTNPPQFPVIFTFWHNRIPAITLCFMRVYPRFRKGVFVLTSPSRDGEILARVMAEFRMGSIRGSSNKRAARALMELRRTLRDGYDVAVTPDGPRGPKYVLSPGVVYVAQATGAPLLPMHARYGRSLKLRSWDEFRIPLPFSTIYAATSPYEAIPPTGDFDELEAHRARVERILRDEAD